MDLIDRQAAIDTVEFGITYAKAINKSTGEVRELFKEGNKALNEAVERLKDLPSAQPEQRWIPCSERLPEESGRYLVSVLDGVGRKTTVAPYQPRYKAWTMTGRMAYWKVIAWMPFPEPYGEERTEE